MPSLKTVAAALLLEEYCDTTAVMAGRKGGRGFSICQSAPRIKRATTVAPTCTGAVLLQLVRSFATARPKRT
jgi:hypothetical protein